MQFHSNAATNRQQRRFMRHSSQSCRVLAAQFCVSPATVHTWKQREDTFDRSCRPHTIHYALCDQEEAMVLWMRQNGELSLDDLLESAEPLLPHLRRSSLHRLLVRHGCNRLPKKEQQATGQPGTFKEYGPATCTLTASIFPSWMVKSTIASWPLTGPRAWCSSGFTKTRTRRPPLIS